MRDDQAGEHDGGDPRSADAQGRGAYEALRDGGELLASGNAHAAVVALEHARALEPEKASVRETLARAYYRTLRFDDAAAEFATAIELDPVNDYAHFGLGLALRRTGDVIGARRHLRIATVMRPGNADYQRALADVVGDHSDGGDRGTDADGGDRGVDADGGDRGADAGVGDRGVDGKGRDRGAERDGRDRGADRDGRDRGAERDRGDRGVDGNGRDRGAGPGDA